MQNSKYKYLNVKVFKIRHELRSLHKKIEIMFIGS